MDYVASLTPPQLADLATRYAKLYPTDKARIQKLMYPLIVFSNALQKSDMLNKSSLLYDRFQRETGNVKIAADKVLFWLDDKTPVTEKTIKEAFWISREDVWQQFVKFVKDFGQGLVKGTADSVIKLYSAAKEVVRDVIIFVARTIGEGVKEFGKGLGLTGILTAGAILLGGYFLITTLTKGKRRQNA